MSHSISIKHPLTAAAHFKLRFLSAALRVAEQLAGENALGEFPFLEDYLSEIADLSGAACVPGAPVQPWFEAVERWEAALPATFPLRILSDALDLPEDARTLLLTVGLIEEDPRFGGVFEWAQPGSPGQQRPTLGLLTAWLRQDDDCAGVRENVRRLRELGLIEVVNPEAPRIQWAFQAQPLAWDVLRGERLSSAPAWLDWRAPETLPALSGLVLPDGLREKAEAIPRLLASGEARAVIVRGPLHNGRKTLLRAIARGMGHGTLELRAALKPEDDRWNWLGTLATLLRAVPILTFELGPGEVTAVPEFAAYRGPQGIALSRQGSLAGAVMDAALTLELPLPGAEARARLWERSLGDGGAPEWASRFRLTSGGIVRSAGLARAQCVLEGRAAADERDVRHANRALQQPLENLAARLQTSGGGWEQMVSSADTLEELRTLESRCRYREELPGAMGPALSGSVNHGVRALFSGPSGTGKTLGAKLLAAELGMDIYRLDLSAVVNKYVGETEKNLNQAFARAEELDVVLLLDEGDALLTNRTSVQSSNDRYANLETNFLLQRIESFEGILVVTTNAAERIDSAFQRRMDIVVDFRLPEPEERWALWQLHLPPAHAVDAAWVEEAAQRCSLSGGQIRNAALHASLLALGRAGAVSTADAERAVQREYRKIGAVCPLRRPSHRR